MRLVLTGVTGVAGLAVYRAAVSDPAVTHITVLTRRPIPPWAVLPPNAASKTSVILHNDFLSYSPELIGRLKENDACIWALGKSSVGMNEEQYTELTCSMLMAAVGALRDGGVFASRSSSKPFRFVYFSSEMADPTGSASQMWARVKGQAENTLTELAQSEPNIRVHLIRPGYFFPSKHYPADRQHQRPLKARIMDCAMTPVLSLFAPYYITPIEGFAPFVVELAKGRWPDSTLMKNKEIRERMRELS